MENVFLVSCVSKKKNYLCKAKDMYISPWFLLARKYVEERGGRWYILSALYGLIHPEKEIQPYDLSLESIAKEKRWSWGLIVAKQLDHAVPLCSTLTIFAGRSYRDELWPYLTKRVTEGIVVPMAGLGIGEQLKWLKERTHAGK